jgi:hypothetical protein
VSGPDDTANDVARIDRLYREKARAEIAAADREVRGASAVAYSGDELADVLLVTGVPSAADAEAGRALAGAAGEAIGKALDALGLSPRRGALSSRAGSGSGPARARRLSLAIEAVDPRVVVALDADAAADLARAFDVPALAPGAPVTVRGRVALATDDFAASLGDERAKRRVWRELKALEAAVPNGTKTARAGAPDTPEAQRPGAPGTPSGRP